MSELVTVKVGGKRYEFWKSASIKRSLDTVAGEFKLDVTKTLGASPWDMAVQQEVEVLLGADTVLTGHIDTIAQSVAANANNVSVSGRDKTADLVDCSAINKPGEFKKIGLLDLCKKLAEPFGIDVRLEAPAGDKFGVFSIQSGETAFEAIQRACVLRSVLPMTDGRGTLVLAQGGGERVPGALVLGENIQTITRNDSFRNRFSKYIVFAQREVPGDGWLGGGGGTLSISAEASDSVINRYRPTMIRAEGQATRKWAKGRAEWSAIVRAAQSQKVTVQVPTWRRPDGKLWGVNQVVPVKAPELGIDGTLLTTEVEYALSEGGTSCKMTLLRKDAFIPKPKPIEAPETSSADFLSGGLKFKK